MPIYLLSQCISINHLQGAACHALLAPAGKPLSPFQVHGKAMVAIRKYRSLP
jgi:hypothetical protein